MINLEKTRLANPFECTFFPKNGNDSMKNIQINENSTKASENPFEDDEYYRMDDNLK